MLKRRSLFVVMDSGEDVKLEIRRGEISILRDSLNFYEKLSSDDEDDEDKIDSLSIDMKVTLKAKDKYLGVN